MLSALTGLLDKLLPKYCTNSEFCLFSSWVTVLSSAKVVLELTLAALMAGLGRRIEPVGGWGELVRMSPWRLVSLISPLPGRPAPVSNCGKSNGDSPAAVGTLPLVFPGVVAISKLNGLPA